MTSGQNEAAQSLKDPIPKPIDCADGLPFSGVQSVRQWLADNKALIHNFTGDKMAIYKLVAKASSPLVKRGADNKDAIIKPSNFLAQYVEMTQERTGEVVDSPRVVIFDKDGTMYGFVSWGVLDSVDQLVSTFGMYNWPDGIALKIVEANTRRGNRIVSLVPID